MTKELLEAAIKTERWSGQERDAVIVGRKLSYVAVPAAVGLLSYASWNHQDFLAILGAGLLVSVASLVSGALAGFLFGIPKSGGRGKQTSEGSVDEDKVSAPIDGLRRNTNIEEISDWLTKIIVGLGIFELKNIPRLLVRLATFLSPAFGGKAGSGAVAVTLGVAFAASGFLLGYLLTVLFITQAIRRADPSMRAEENLEQDAKAAKLVATVTGQSAEGEVPSNVREEILMLARRYERERAARAPGPQRTVIMEEITSGMRQLALVAESMIHELSTSESPGERLAAVAIIQIKPDASYLQWLAERFSIEVPFIRFQAALALRNAVRSLSPGHHAELSSAIDQAKKSLASQNAVDTEEYEKVIEAERELV